MNYFNLFKQLSPISFVTTVINIAISPLVIENNVTYKGLGKITCKEILPRF